MLKRSIFGNAQNAIVVEVTRHAAPLGPVLPLPRSGAPGPKALGSSVRGVNAADDLACPNCGEDDELAGRKTGAPDSPTITVTCGCCQLSWERDLRPRCSTCGSTDVRVALQSIVDKSRGTQLSIQSMRVSHLCPTCDPERLTDWNQTNSPLSPEELPHDVN